MTPNKTLKNNTDRQKQIKLSNYGMVSDNWNYDLFRIQEKLHLNINTIYMEESNVPYGLYKYTGIEWMQYFAKSRYNINIKHHRNVRKTKKGGNW